MKSFILFNSILILLFFLQVFIWKTNFTEVASEMKENIEQRVPTSQNSKSTTSVKAKKQVVKKPFRF